MQHYEIVTAVLLCCTFIVLLVWMLDSYKQYEQLSARVKQILSIYGQDVSVTSKQLMDCCADAVVMRETCFPVVRCMYADLIEICVAANTKLVSSMH